MSQSVEQRIRALQQEAYIRLLRVVCAQPYNWETEALLTNTRKLLKISLDEHSTFMKECRPGGRYCLQIPQQQEQPMPHMQQFRGQSMQPMRNSSQAHMPNPMMMPQHEMMEMQGYAPAHGGQMMAPGSRDKGSWR
eukprot:jgi/Ulvmu1/940/UM102_0023.1